MGCRLLPRGLSALVSAWARNRQRAQRIGELAGYWTGPGTVLANSGQANAALMTETDVARELGIFGSPTFTVGRELFWGDDRERNAIDWCRSGRIHRG